MNKKPLIIIFLTVFVDLVGFGIIIPLTPYLARYYHATAFDIGLLMAIYSGMQFLFSPLWGGLSDRFGRRPILLMSIAMTALANLVFFYANSLPMLFVSRALAGAFSANIATSAAFIADVTEQKDRSKNMGLIGAAFGLGFVLGPALGGLSAKVSIHFPALVATLIGVVNFVAAFFILPESLPPEKRGKKVRKSRIRSISEKIARPVIGTLLGSNFVVAFAMASMEATLFLFVQDRFSWSLQKASYGFAYVGICIAFTQGYLVRKLLPKFGERTMLTSGVLMFSTSFVLIGLAHSIWFLAIAMTLLALGDGLLMPALSGSLSLLTDQHEQGEVMGVNQSMSAMARIFGPPIGGILYGRVAMVSPFYFSALLGYVALSMIWLNRHRLPAFKVSTKTA